MLSQQPPGNSKPSIFQWKSARIASRQFPGGSEPSLMASQQPSGDSETINISLEKCTDGVTAASSMPGPTAASWRFQNRLYLFGFQHPPGSTKPSIFHGNSKPSIFHWKSAQLASQQPINDGITAASWRFQNH